MQMMIKAKDLYYLPRIKNLKREYKMCEEKLKILQEEFDNKVHSETGSYYLLTVLSDKIHMVLDLMKSLENQIKILKLENLN